MYIKTHNGWVSLNPTNYDAETQAFWDGERRLLSERFEVNATHALVNIVGSMHDFRKVRDLTPQEKATSRAIRKGTQRL